MEAVIFCGIQATGKSTFYKEKYFRSHVHISLDLLNTRHREEQFLQVCFKTSQPFVVDNTNPSRKDREKYIALAKQNNYKITGYYFQSKIKEALERNSQRKELEYIPEIGIKGTFNQLQIPTFEEGFDELYYVELNNNNFSIKEWTNEI